MPSQPITEAFGTKGHYHSSAHAKRVDTVVIPNDNNRVIGIDQIDGIPDSATKAKLYKTYQNTWWEFEPGEERADHEEQFDSFLAKQKHLTTFVAHDPASHEVVGISYSYDNPPDHPLTTKRDHRLAGIAVAEDMQHHGIGTRLVKNENAVAVDRGAHQVVLAYDEPGKHLYARFHMKQSDEMRANVAGLASEPLLIPSDAIVREADLRTRRDVAMVTQYERAQPQYAASAKKLNDAKAFFQERPDTKAWIVADRESGQVQGATLASEWEYPVAKTWTPEYLKMLSIPGIRTGKIDPSSGEITSISPEKQKIASYMLLAEAIEHAKRNEYTKIRVDDTGPTRSLLEEHGFTPAPVLTMNYDTTIRTSMDSDS
jgi:GNAT superfamily N-acetyltransferase